MHVERIGLCCSPPVPVAVRPRAQGWDAFGGKTGATVKRESVAVLEVAVTPGTVVVTVSWEAIHATMRNSKEPVVVVAPLVKTARATRERKAAQAAVPAGVQIVALVAAGDLAGVAAGGLAKVAEVADILAVAEVDST